MDCSGLLVASSWAQLVAGAAGQRVAVRGGRAFDIAGIGWRGQPDRVAHDTWLIGTGLSAPVWMQVVQAGVTVRLARSPSVGAARTLGVLGAVMCGGYLVEHEFREAVRHPRRDPVTTCVAVAGLGLAVVMAVAGVSWRGAAET